MQNGINNKKSYNSKCKQLIIFSFAALLYKRITRLDKIYHKVLIKYSSTNVLVLFATSVNGCDCEDPWVQASSSPCYTQRQQKQSRVLAELRLDVIFRKGGAALMERRITIFSIILYNQPTEITRLSQV